MGYENSNSFTPIEDHLKVNPEINPIKKENENKNKPK